MYQFVCIDGKRDKSSWCIEGNDEKLFWASNEQVKEQLSNGIRIANLSIAENGQIVFKRELATEQFQDVKFLRNVLNTLYYNYDIIPTIIQTYMDMEDNNTYSSKYMCSLIETIFNVYKSYFTPITYKNKEIAFTTEEYKKSLESADYKNIIGFHAKSECYTVYGISMLYKFTEELDKEMLRCLHTQSKTFHLERIQTNQKIDIIKNFDKIYEKHIREKEALLSKNRENLINVYSNLNKRLSTENSETTLNYEECLKDNEEYIKNTISEYMQVESSSITNKNVFDFITVTITIFSSVGLNKKYTDMLNLAVDATKWYKDKVVARYKGVLGNELYNKLSKLYEKDKYTMFYTLFVVEWGKGVRGKGNIQNIYALPKSKELKRQYFRPNLVDKSIGIRLPYNTATLQNMQNLAYDNLASCKINDRYANTLTYYILLYLRVFDTYLDIPNGKLGVSAEHAFCIDSITLLGMDDFDEKILVVSWLQTIVFMNKYVKPEYRNNDIVFGVIFKDYCEKFFKECHDTFHIKQDKIDDMLNIWLFCPYTRYMTMHMYEYIHFHYMILAKWAKQNKVKFELTDDVSKDALLRKHL